MRAMGLDSVAGLKAKLPALRAELKSKDVFASVWNWAYEFNCEEGQKSLKLETAIALVPMLMSRERWPLVDTWIEFLSRPGTRAVSKDSWKQLLDFVNTINPKLTNFDESSSSWPVCIDEFVEYCRSHKKV